MTLTQGNCYAKTSQAVPHLVKTEDLAMNGTP
jgi:hypothetical protein